MTPREVSELLSPREFSQLCGLVDFNFGRKSTEVVGGNTLSRGSGTLSAVRNGFTRFDVVRVERSAEKFVVLIELEDNRQFSVDLRTATGVAA